MIFSRTGLPSNIGLGCKGLPRSNTLVCQGETLVSSSTLKVAESLPCNNVSEVKLPNLELITWPKELLGCFQLDIALPAQANFVESWLTKIKSFITPTTGKKGSQWWIK